VIATSPVPQLIVVRIGTFTQRRRRDITDVTAPAHPLGSVDLQVLRAWIEAELAHPGDARLAATAVATAIERVQGRQSTSGQVGDVYERIPAELRPLFGRRSGEALRLLIGRWVRDGVASVRFAPGLARLTEDEAAVYDWDVRGWRFEDIQRELTKQRLGSKRAFAVLWAGDRSRWVPAEDVDELLESAGAKVRRVFGVGE
jgi:hypothetical protein